jgi:hypothetical protein
METFTAIIKNHGSLDKSRTIKVSAEDTWHAHKEACSYYNEIKEFIPTIKDNRGNEVYNIEKGFIFE